MEHHLPYVNCHLTQVNVLQFDLSLAGYPRLKAELTLLIG